MQNEEREKSVMVPDTITEILTKQRIS